MRRYRVTYARDYLDTKPTIKEFDSHDEMQDWTNIEMDKRVMETIDLRGEPLPVPPEEYYEMYEIDHSLLKVELL